MRTRLKEIALSLLMLLSSTGAACADDELFDPHFYYGFGVGTSQVKHNEANIIQNSSLTPAASFEDQYTVFRLYFGYQFDPLLGVEFGVPLLADSVVVDNGSKYKLFTTNGSSLEAVLSHRINDDVTLFGKFGVVMWAISPDGGETRLDEGTGMTYGFGVNLNLYGSNERSMRIGIQHYEMSDVYIQSVDTVTVSLHMLVF